MSTTALRLTVLATAVALSGCTVYVNNKPPARQQVGQTRQPPKTTAKTPVTPNVRSIR